MGIWHKDRKNLKKKRIFSNFKFKEIAINHNKELTAPAPPATVS